VTAGLRLSACAGAALALVLAGCSRWQTRADNLQQTLDAFAASGQKHKSDFVGRYGPPTSCKAEPAGEQCVWRGPYGTLGGGTPAAAPASGAPATERLRVIFDKDGIYLSGTGGVRRGKRTYRGVTEAQEEADDAPDGGCQPGEVFQNGRCYATSPGGGPPGVNPPNMNTP
jgi:hypothetical protein